MRRFAPLFALAIVATACAGPVTTATNPPETSSPPSTTTTLPATTAPVPAEPDASSPCLEGDRPFANGGVISAFGGASGDAAQISGIRTARHVGCERIVVDLLTVDGAPAGSVGLTGVEYNESVGVVRINLPRDITRTAVTDLLLDGDLSSRAFVIRTTAGHLAIDIHVVPGTSVALRAFEVDAPSRIVVDLRSNPDVPAVRGATIGHGIVVIEPAPGVATVPLQVLGYARTFEAGVVARLYESREGDAFAEAATTAADWTEAWGEFAVVFRDAPLRPLEMFVGEDSPNNGLSDGVWLSLDLGDTGDTDAADN